MNACVFCKIAKGEIDSAKIYQNDDVVAFLDITPFSKGHCLIVPKKHFENLFDIESETLQKVIVAGKLIAEKIQKTFNADGIRLSQSNGKAAGQDIMHFHLHIIPRYRDDGLSISPIATSHRPKADISELKRQAEQIKLVGGL